MAFILATLADRVFETERAGEAEGAVSTCRIGWEHDKPISYYLHTNILCGDAGCEFVFCLIARDRHKNEDTAIFDTHHASHIIPRQHREPVRQLLMLMVRSLFDYTRPETFLMRTYNPIMDVKALRKI